MCMKYCIPVSSEGLFRIIVDHHHMSRSLFRVNQRDLCNQLHMHYKGLHVNTVY